MAAGGNLLVKGPNVMEGYLLARPGVRAGGGVVRLRRRGQRGRRRLRDAYEARLKRFAKVSGEMVSLDAVEQSGPEVFRHRPQGGGGQPPRRPEGGEDRPVRGMHRGASKQALQGVS